MTLDAKALGISGGILWAAGLVVFSIISALTGYGAAFVDLIAGVYPGYALAPLGVTIGAVLGFIDFFVGFFLLAWLYNKLLGRV